MEESEALAMKPANAYKYLRVPPTRIYYTCGPPRGGVLYRKY